MRRNIAPHHGSGLKTAWLFVVVVFLIIFFSLAVKFIIALKNSSFDGQHEFVLLIRSDNNKGMLALFQPVSPSSVVVLPLDSIDGQDVAADLHLGIDGTIDANFDKVTSKKDVKSIIFEAIFNAQVDKSHVNWLDMLRLWMVANTASYTFIPLDNLPQNNLTGTMGQPLPIHTGI